MKIALKMKDSAFSAFSQFESGKLTSERRQASLRRFHVKSGVSGPSILFVKHQRCLGGFLKAPEIKGALHRARLQNFRVLINFFRILKHFEVCSSQKHALQRSQKLCTYFEGIFHVSDGFQYLFRYQNHFFETN